MGKYRLSLKFVFALLALLLFSGCASSIMQQSQPLVLDQSDKALVTFMRPSIFGGVIQFGLWDKDQFIGVLSAGSQVQYLTEPGEHLFLSRAENWSYVKADLAAGKQYFILGNIFPGVWKARVALSPLAFPGKHTEAELEAWQQKLKPMQVIPEKFDEYTQPRVEQVRKAVADYEAGKVKFAELNKEAGR